MYSHNNPEAQSANDTMTQANLLVQKKNSTADEQRNVRATYALAFCFVRVVAVVALIAHAKAKR